MLKCFISQLLTSLLPTAAEPARSVPPGGSLLALLAGPTILLALFVSGLLLLIKGRPFFRLWMTLLGATAGLLLADNLLLWGGSLLSPFAVQLYIILPLAGALLLGLLFRLSFVAAGWLAGSLLAGSLLPDSLPSFWLLAGRLVCGLAGALLARRAAQLFIRLATAGGGSWLSLTAGWRLFDVYVKPLLSGLSAANKTGEAAAALPTLTSWADFKNLLLPPANPTWWFWALFFALALLAFLLQRSRR